MARLDPAIHVAPRIMVLETVMDNLRGPNIKKRPKCKNCEGKGLLKKGDKVVKCQRRKGTGVRGGAMLATDRSPQKRSAMRDRLPSRISLRSFGLRVPRHPRARALLRLVVAG